MKTHQPILTDPMPQGANRPVRARLGEGRKALLFITAILLLWTSAPAAQPPAGQVVSWGLVENFPYVRPGTVFTNVVCGGGHNLGITKERTVISWGGLYDPPAGLSNVIAAASSGGGDFALKSDGTVVGWGTRDVLTVPPGLNGVKAIAASGSHCLALRKTGTVIAWGEGQSGATNVPSGLADVVGIAAGSAQSVALKSDGTLVAWGDNSFGQTDVPAGLINVVQISAAVSNTLALKADGTVVAWGDTNYGVTLVPPGLSDVVQVGCGALAVALRGNGTVAFWGEKNNSFGGDYEHATNVLARLREVVEISVAGYSGVARKRDGTFVAWGAPGYQRSVPPLFTDVVSFGSGGPGMHFLTDQAQLLAASSYGDDVLPSDGLTNIAAFADAGTGEIPGSLIDFTLAVRKDGTVVAWGVTNVFGQLDVPPGLSNVLNVAAGLTYGVALKSDGTVAAWGGDQGLGMTTEITNVPAGLNDVRSIAAGPYAILVVRSNGTLASWGDTIPAGQPALNDAVAASFAYTHGLALRSNGTVVAWGDNFYGQTNVPPGLSNVVAVSAGLARSVALKSDGKVVAWGRPYGRRTIPPGLKNVVAVSTAHNDGAYALVLDPELSTIRRDGSGVVLGFRSFLGQAYQIQYSTDLSPNSWFNLPGGDVTGTGAEMEVTDSNVLPAQSTRFYRLVELD